MVLVLEVTSTRLYAYIGGSHATSTALSFAVLGLGAGAFARLRWSRHLAPPRIALALALALFGYAVAVILGLALPGLVALSLIPFAAAGILISEAYAARGSQRARATYAIDLAGAAAGCVVAPRLIGPLAPTEIVLVLAVASCGLAAILVGRRRARAWIALLAALDLGLLAASRAGALPDGPLEVLLAVDRRSEKAIVELPTTTRDVVDSAWSPLGRLDVRAAPEGRLGVFTDGMSPTYLVEEARGRSGSFERTWGLLLSLPYRALRPARVLVLGAGAGASVWLAKKYGASQVDAVEVNPAIPALMARWKHVGGEVYGQPGVRLVIADARRHLTDTDARYDLIELALALTGNAQAQPSGMEAHLYTVEAVGLYLRRLTPAGVLVLIHSDPGNAYRQLRTVLQALEELGVARDRALEGIVVMRDPRPGTAYRYLLVVRTSPMPLEVTDRLDLPPAELLWAPGDPPERGRELLDPAKLGATGADDLTPVHDERPYFFQNTRGLAAIAFAEPGRLWVLAGAIVLVVALILERRRAEMFDGATRSFVRPALVASGLGAAYLGVELAVIQRFTLAAGGTLYAVSFVLCVVLGWSAVGAWLLGGRWRRLERGVSWACLAAGLAVGATAVVARDLGWLEAISSDPARLLVTAVLLAPAGIAIGGPFPVLLVHQGEPADRIASLWAVNGAAAVAGGIVAVIVLRAAGASDALVVAAGIYGAAAVVAPRAPR